MEAVRQSDLSPKIPLFGHDYSVMWKLWFSIGSKLVVHWQLLFSDGGSVKDMWYNQPVGCAADGPSASRGERRL